MMTMHIRNKTKMVAQCKQLQMKRQTPNSRGYLDPIWKDRSAVLNEKMKTFLSFIFVLYWRENRALHFPDTTRKHIHNDTQI